MSLTDLLRTALRSVSANKLRAALTMRLDDAVGDARTLRDTAPGRRDERGASQRREFAPKPASGKTSAPIGSSLADAFSRAKK